MIREAGDDQIDAQAVAHSPERRIAPVFRHTPTGSTLLFSSLIGGTDNQGGFTLRGLAVDALESIYVASYTSDTTLPTTPGAFQPVLKNPGTGNSYDGFIARFSLAPLIASGGIGPIYSISATIQPGEWVSIYGANLAGASATWTGNFPTLLGGTSVTINGKQAYSVLLRSTCRLPTTQPRDPSPSWSPRRTEAHRPPLPSPNLLLRSTCSIRNTLRASS